MDTYAAFRAVDSAAQMLVQRGVLEVAVALVGALCHPVFGEGITQAALRLFGVELVGLAKYHLLVQDALVAGDVDILVGDIHEPEIVVAEGGAGSGHHALMPPVQHVAFGKLMGGMVQNLAAGIVGVAVEAGHDVLQLVAEAGGAAHLVESGAGKEARRVDLVEVPAVQHIVEGLVGGLHLDGVQPLVPKVAHLSVFLFDKGDGKVACRFVRRFHHTDDIRRLLLTSGGKGEGEAHPLAVGTFGLQQGQRLGGGQLQPGVAVDFVIDVAHPQAVLFGMPLVVEVAGGRLFGHTQHQLVHHVEGYVERLVGLVLNLYLVVFLKTLAGHEHAHHHLEVVVFGIKGREALSVTCGGGNKLLLVDEEHLGGVVPHDVVAPSGEFETLCVEGEGEASHRGAYNAAEPRVGEHVDPRHGGVGVGDHIVVTVAVEAAVLVVEIQRAPHTEVGAGFPHRVFHHVLVVLVSLLQIQQLLLQRLAVAGVEGETCHSAQQDAFLVAYLVAVEDIDMTLFLMGGPQVLGVGDVADEVGETLALLALLVVDEHHVQHQAVYLIIFIRAHDFFCKT